MVASAEAVTVVLDFTNLSNGPSTNGLISTTGTVSGTLVEGDTVASFTYTGNDGIVFSFDILGSPDPFDIANGNTLRLGISGNIDQDNAITISNIVSPNNDLDVNSFTLTEARDSGSGAGAIFNIPSDTLVISDATTVGNVQRVTGFTLEFDQVPEPSSIALLGLGSLALLGRRKRA